MGCDASTVAASDRVHFEVIYPIYAGVSGENYSLRFNEQQRWFYYPSMTKTECLVFKTFDKSKEGARFAFHCAFDDPKTPEGASARESIEIRAIAFFGDDLDEEDVLQCKVK